jgi:two-component system CitB family sensor kinase
VTGVTIPRVRIVTTSRRLPRLSTQLLLLQLAIILLTVGVSSVVVYLHSRADIAKRAGAESLSIAQTVATDGRIVAALTRPDGAKVIDPIAERIRRATGASFVVVANRRGIRMSHPNPKLIGKSLLHDPGENPAATFAGKTFVGEQPGSLGWSMRAKVPIRNAQGRVIGLVSVGVLEKAIASEFRDSLPVILVPLLVALTLATLGAFLLARRVKRQTFGLEPDEIGVLPSRGRRCCTESVRARSPSISQDGSH